MKCSNCGLGNFKVVNIDTIQFIEYKTNERSRLLDVAIAYHCDECGMILFELSKFNNLNEEDRYI